MWIGVFPPDAVQATALIASSVVTAVMGHATKLLTQTFQAARRVQSAAANASATRLCMAMGLA